MSPWAESVPPTVASLATTGPSRALWPGLAIVGCTLVTGLVVWAAATGRVNAPAQHQPAANAQPIARGEPADDPLPEGSKLRFGTDRFRHGTTIQNLSISADGKIAVAGSGTRRFGSIGVYDLATGRVLATLAEQHEYVVAVALSPDGKLIAVKRGDHAVHFYDAATGRVAGQISYPTANPSSMTEWVSFSPDGKRVLVGTATGDGVHLIDRDKIDVIRTFKHEKVVFAAAFSPDGKLVAAGGYDSDKNVYFARLWDANTGAELRHFKFGNGGIRCLEFSPDGKTLAIGGDGGSPLGVKLFEVATAKELTRIVFPDASRVSVGRVFAGRQDAGRFRRVHHATVRRRDRQGEAQDRPQGNRPPVRAGWGNADRGGLRNDLPLGREDGEAGHARIHRRRGRPDRGDG